MLTQEYWSERIAHPPSKLVFNLLVWWVFGTEVGGSTGNVAIISGKAEQGTA